MFALSFSVVVPSQVQNIINVLKSVHCGYHYNRSTLHQVHLHFYTFVVMLLILALTTHIYAKVEEVEL